MEVCSWINRQPMADVGGDVVPDTHTLPFCSVTIFKRGGEHM